MIAWLEKPNAPKLMALVTIPEGSFVMGDTLDGTSMPHTVHLSAYSIESTHVTGQLWSDIAKQAASLGMVFTSGRWKMPNHPVQTVTFGDVLRWCNARSIIDGYKMCYDVTDQAAPICNWSANGWRLPTEAEWEKAARGGLAGLRFPKENKIQQTYANYYGQTYYPYDLGPNGYAAQYAVGSKPFTSPVADHMPNGFGLHDMAGNVGQWCWDWYNVGYYRISPYTDPTGPTVGLDRVIRGGGWNNYAGACRCAYRSHGKSPLNSVGFRCVRGVD